MPITVKDQKAANAATVSVNGHAHHGNGHHSGNGKSDALVERAERRRDTRMVATVIVAYAGIVVPLALTVNIWIDEAYSLLTTSRDFAYAIKHSREFETQPPFYYAVLWLWRQLDHSVGFARLSSVIAGGAALWMLHLAVRRWLPNTRSIWLIAPFSINASFLYGATEIRAYAFLVFLGGALLVLFYDGFYAEPRKRWAAAAYAVAALIAPTSFYYMGFMLVPPAVVLLVERRWRRLAEYLAWMSAVGAIFYPIFRLGSEHMGIVSHALSDMPSPIRSVELVFARLVSMPFSFTFLDAPYKWIGMFAAMAITVASLVFYRKRITREVRALWIIGAGMAVAYALVVQFIMGEYVLNRHFIPLLVPSTMAVFSLVSLYGKNMRTAAAVWMVMALSCNAVASFEKFRPLAKVGDFGRVAKYLMAHEVPGQSIIVVASHAELPLRYYYHGTSKVVPLPEMDDYVNYVFEEWRLPSVERVSEQLAAATSPDGLVWVYMDRPATTEFFGVYLNFDYLETALAADYTLVEDRTFYYGDLRLFRRKAGDAPAPQAVSRADVESGSSE